MKTQHKKAVQMKKTLDDVLEEIKKKQVPASND